MGKILIQWLVGIVVVFALCVMGYFWYIFFMTAY